LGRYGDAADVLAGVLAPLERPDLLPRRALGQARFGVPERGQEGHGLLVQQAADLAGQVVVAAAGVESEDVEEVLVAGGVVGDLADGAGGGAALAVAPEVGCLQAVEDPGPQRLPLLLLPWLGGPAAL